MNNSFYIPDSFQNELEESFPASNLKAMLDSVGIRLPTYKVREMVLSMKDRGNLGEEELIDKLMFVQVKCLNNVQTVEDVIHIRTCMRTQLAHHRLCCMLFTSNITTILFLRIWTLLIEFMNPFGLSFVDILDLGVKK